MNDIVKGILIFFGVCILMVTIWVCVYLFKTYLKQKQDIGSYNPHYNNHNIYATTADITNQGFSDSNTKSQNNHVYRYPGYIEI